jgi:hypothetical protein
MMDFKRQLDVLEEQVRTLEAKLEVLRMAQPHHEVTSIDDTGYDVVIGAVRVPKRTSRRATQSRSANAPRADDATKIDPPVPPDKGVGDVVL